MAGPFDAYFEQLKQQEAARTAARVRLDPLQPDQAADGLATAKELGVPAGQVMAFPQLFKDRLEQQRAAAALAEAPKLSDWLRSDPVNAALAKDDLENLSWFERNLKPGLDLYGDAVGGSLNDSQVGRGFRTGVTGAKQMGMAAATVPIAGAQATMLQRLDAFDRAKDIDPSTPRFQIAEQLGLDPMSPTAAMVADFVASDADKRKWYVDRTITAVQSNKELMAALTSSVQAYRDQMRETQGRVPDFTDIGDVKGFMDWAGFNLGQAAPFLLTTLAASAAAGPAGALGAGYGMGVGDIRAEQITAGQDPFDTGAVGAAVAGAVPYAGLELLGPAARPFRGASGEVLQQVAEGWAKRLGREVTTDVIEEFINEAGQEIIKDYAVQMGGGAEVELNDETLLKWFNAGMAGAVAGGGLSTISTANTIAAERDAERARNAGRTAAALDRASQQAQASRVRERSPESFKAALDRAGAGDQMIYVPAQGLREFFQARDVAFDDAMAEQWGVDLDTFAEMEISGGRVAIPLSNFAAYLSGTDAEAWVRENATMDADELSIAEAQAFADLVPEEAAGAYEQQLAEMRAEDEARSSDQQVYDGFYSQLREAGRTTDVADKEARVMFAFFRTMAERVGDDALDLAQRFGVRIQGPDSGSLPRRRGALDVMLNDMRAGRKEKTGRSLTQFVIDEGGVQDAGGDVAALEIKGLVAETADQISERQAQGTMPGMMPAQGRGLPLDELGRKAVEAGYFPELMGEVQGLNDGEAADLGAALLEALREEASGRMRYLPGEGPDPARAALNAELQARGLDPATMSNDEIAAALEEGAGDTFWQSARMGEIEAMASSLGVDLAVSERNGYITISRIVSGERGSGAGSRVMQAVADHADASGQVIALTPSADFGGSVARLREFYKRFGFVENKGRNKDFGTRETMVRPPADLRTLFQSSHDKGGRAALASMNGDMTLRAVAIPDTARADDRKSALAKLSDAKGEYRTASGESVTISRATRKIFSGSFPEGRLRLAGAIPDLLQSAVVYNADTPQRAYAVALADLDGQSIIVRMVLNDDGSGSEKLYALEGFEMAPIAWRDAKAEVSDQEQVGAKPAMGSAPGFNVATAVAQINALPSGAPPLFQTRRGSIVFPAGGPDGAQTVINLFETADLSTFLHEAGHFFLETSDALARADDAPQQLRDDMAAVRAYLGAEEGVAFTTEQHETFARSFEAYVMEGKAPSLALADVFARIKAWLTRIYRSMAGLNVKLSPEIREVFDRMLATDAEIAQARAETAADPLFRDRPPGMSETDWNTYQRLARRSKEQAEAKLLEKTMAKVRREKESWWKAERKQLRAEVEARTNSLPQYRLIEAMANGRILTLDGEQPAPDVRISRKDLVEQFGPGVLAELSRERFGGKRAIYADDGLSTGVAAEMFGFAGAVEMVQILQNTTKRIDAINAETDRIMLERYGDPMTDGTIEQEAVDAIHNEQQAQKNVAEARQIAAQLGRDTRSMTATLYRQRARLMLGRMTVREASAPARFLAAERRAGREAERAFARVARGDASALAAALQAKEQQILNAALFDLSREAEAEVGKAREKMQAYGKKSVREKLEGGYIEQIDDLLDRYDFRRRSPGQVAKTERLREFVDRMIAEGREAELMIDPRMMDDARRVHYSRLSLDEFRGLLDTVANLDHLGRFKQKLVSARKQRDLAATATAVADAIATNIGTGRIKQESRGRYLLDLVLTADTVLVDVDGGDEFGTAYQAIKEDIDAGYVRVDEMNRELSERLSDLFKVYSAKDIRDMKVERHINGTRFMWSKWKAIAVALNTGNEDNLARLLAPDAHADQRMTRADLDAVLDTLDQRDWDFVQSMWDLIGSYWPQIEAVTQRRTGVKPGRVEARQVATKFGTYKGGYYPIKYDAGYGHAAALDARTELDKFMSAGRFAKAQTKHGHTIDRKKTGNGRTLNLDMDVAFTHLRDVIRDIALSEAVDNSYRVLNHPRVAQAFMDAGRKNDLDMMNLWLKDVAQGPIVHTDPLNMFARIVKNNFTLSRLALNMKTAALQLTGVAQSAATVGKRKMARAFADYLKHPAETSREVMAKSEFMRRRQTTFDKDINDFANDAMITSPLRGRVAKGAEVLARAGFAPLTKVQFYAVDVPTWLAGYRNGLRKFDGDEGRAIAFADRMVARAQDSGAMPDRSAISRGTVSENARQIEWIKLFTTLQGYMIAKFNRGYLTARQGVRDIRAGETVAQRFGATADMATNLMLIYVAETAMMGLLYAAMAAGDDDDELEREKIFTWVLGETVGAVVGGIPLVRDAWSVMSNPAATGGGVYGSITEIPARLVQQAAQGENDKALRRAVADAVGLATGLPSTAAMRPIEELLEDSDERSLIEALMGRNPLID
ncbi:hypothetical protein [Paracoccus versutus]|uniref:N-acetyltransferase domain-containing protein n=1 Tax=Paracoccus versutus TaxID=34007 RepID=A0A3D9XLA7_PARVE|nr:hypothetical protein [Paracoccus versutus]REF70411.1 hypothetical protein BDD41_3143 [Paracoccus versutus]WGR57282.1 hypothetical protein E3U25_14865 [Paracoccus versutus]